MRQLTREEAIAFARQKGYANWTPEQIAAFQLEQELMCMNLSDYQEAMEKALGRPVWTHEFAKPELLKAELLKQIKTPSLEEIINKIPKEKLIVVVAP
jgi:hypothetical protein